MQDFEDPRIRELDARIALITGYQNGLAAIAQEEEERAYEFGRGWLRGVLCGVVIGVAVMLAVGRMGA